MNHQYSTETYPSDHNFQTNQLNNGNQQRLTLNMKIKLKNVTEGNSQFRSQHQRSTTQFVQDKAVKRYSDVSRTI